MPARSKGARRCARSSCCTVERLAVTRIAASLAGAAALLWSAACTSVPSASTHAACPATALEQAAADVAGRPVRLAPDAFSTGVVVLQSAAQRDAGRIVTPPERLTLQHEAGRCTMRHLPSQRERALPAACCR